MSTNQNTPTSNNDQTTKVAKEDTTQNKNTQEQPQEQNKKPVICIRSFFKSYFFVFFLATGTAFSAYLISRRFNRN